MSLPASDLTKKPDMRTTMELGAVLPETAEVRDDHLFIGGVDMVELARKEGTALYVFDEADLRHRMEAYREAFRSRYENSDIIYASKAFLNKEVVRIAEAEGLCLDVSGGGELACARSVDFPMERVFVHGNNKTPRELEEATHAKLVFFTNVSHDFRTPLTLIADPINQLLADKSLGEHPHQLLELMKKNANILLRLVNQILDFRKVENGRMELHLEPFDLLSSFRGWNDSFRMALLKKHISFSFEATPDTDFRMMADSEKMERIYFNLLSNAVKYTPENGKIVVKLEAETTNYRFSVFNSGSHISPKEVDAIFERFYQIDGHQAGTGIGLALVRAFVEMHGGQITAHSNEKGATFTVLFPAQSVSLYHPTVVTLPTEEAEVSATLIETDLPLDEEDTKTADRPTVLVIDDNADIRNYVKTLLAEEYHVLDAPEAATGIRLAMKYVPDVIVSDVMMPGMDGIECCRRLKTELQTCHIPVILLTACSLDEQRIQGYNGGADSYISKPFNSQLLLSRIRNLIDSRRQLRQFFGDNQTLAKENICDIDKDFVSRFKSLVEEKMRDPELNVEDLGKDMGLSRVQLYRKLKSLTNYAPNELLRQARLKKAISLLASSEMTVAEIAYEVGFSSPSYFTKCYKEQFGESPTDFLKRKNL